MKKINLLIFIILNIYTNIYCQDETTIITEPITNQETTKPVVHRKIKRKKRRKSTANALNNNTIQKQTQPNDQIGQKPQRSEDKPEITCQDKQIITTEPIVAQENTKPAPQRRTRRKKRRRRPIAQNKKLTTNILDSNDQEEQQSQLLKNKINLEKPEDPQESKNMPDIQIDQNIGNNITTEIQIDSGAENTDSNINAESNNLESENIINQNQPEQNKEINKEILNKDKKEDIRNTQNKTKLNNTKSEKNLRANKNRSQKPKQSYLSMADIPVTPEESIIQQREITNIENPDIQTPPEFNGRIVQQLDSKLRKSIYLASYMEPWKEVPIQIDIQMNFENQELKELLKFLEDNLNIKFILDDDITGAKIEGAKNITGNKITFKSNTPLSLKQIWSLSLTFLEMSGFSVIPTTQDRTYRVTAAQGKTSANNEPLPTFIETDPTVLPDTDLKIRYIYFIENADLDSIVNVVNALRSSSSSEVIPFRELKALIMTDKASSIKSLLNIIQELDKPDVPETLAIIKLKNADASQVQSLYNSLANVEEGTKTPFSFQKKASSTHYFTKATRLFAEPRTNSLIVLGTKENIQKVEDFINKYIDKKPDLPYAPINIYKLKYLQATDLSEVLTKAITDFNTYPGRAEIARAGGVREGSKFFSPELTITPDLKSNSLIIKGGYEEYLKIKELIDSLDTEQPQVALKVLILNVDLTNIRQLGTQSRNSVACCDNTGGTTSILGPNINYQFSGNGPIITDTASLAASTTGTPPANPSGGNRLLGNLINLIDTQNYVTGTTLVTLGKDLYGFWGLVRALESITRVSVVANPFLVTSNNYKAEITIGETRRVLSSIVQAQQTQTSFANLDANLTVRITPLISYDDTVTLPIYVELTQFITEGELPTRSTKMINTVALAENKEVIALGGLVRDLTLEQEYKVPILGDIPLFGWLFKTKAKSVVKSSLLILISPEIIRPNDYNLAQEYTEYRINNTKETLYSMEHFAENRDPIHRWFFKDHRTQEVSEIDKFTSNQGKYISETIREREIAESGIVTNNQILAENNTDNIPKSLLDIIKQDSEQNSINKEVIT